MFGPIRLNRKLMFGPIGSNREQSVRPNRAKRKDPVRPNRSRGRTGPFYSTLLGGTDCSMFSPIGPKREMEGDGEEAGNFRRGREADDEEGRRRATEGGGVEAEGGEGTWTATERELTLSKARATAAAGAGEGDLAGDAAPLFVGAKEGEGREGKRGTRWVQASGLREWVCIAKQKRKG